MADGRIRMRIETDPQAAYDDAKAMVAAWTAFAEMLAKWGRVCDHPPEARTVIDGGPHLCKHCGYVVPGT